MMKVLLGLLGLAAVGTTVAVAASSSKSSTSSRRPRGRLLTLNPDVFAGTFVRTKPPASFALSPSGSPLMLTTRGSGPPGPTWSVPSTGLDANGQWWFQWEGTPWMLATKKSGRSWTEVVEEIASKVMPVVAQIVGAAAGGVPGAAIAFATSTWIKLAQGKSLTRAVLDTAYDQATSLGRAQFAKTLNAIDGAPMATSALEHARAALVATTPPSVRVETAGAFDSAVALGRAKRIQDLAVVEVKRRLPNAGYADALDENLANGIDLKSWIYALFDAKGLELLNQIVARATADVEAGRA